MKLKPMLFVQPKRYRIVLLSLFVAQLLWAVGFVYTARAWGKVGGLAASGTTRSCPDGIPDFFDRNAGLELNERCIREWYDENLPDWIYTALPLVWGGVFASPVLIAVWLFIGALTRGCSWRKSIGLTILSVAGLALTVFAGSIMIASSSFSLWFLNINFFYPLNDTDRPVRLPREADRIKKPFVCWAAPRPAAGDLAGDNGGELLLVVQHKTQSRQELYRYDFASGVYTLSFDKLEEISKWYNGRFSPDSWRLWYVGSDPQDGAEAVFLYDRRLKHSRKLFNLKYGHPQYIWRWAVPMNWSNDGECLFFGKASARGVLPQDVLAYRVSDGAIQPQPAVFAAERFVAGNEVSISHDGGYRALLCDPKDDTMKVCVLSVTGVQEVEVSGLDQGFKNVAWLRWSPVENVLAFAYHETKTFSWRNQVRLVSVSGGQTGTYRNIRLPDSDEAELLWSPDGKRLLIGGRWIYMLETEQMEELADAKIPVGEAAWSPDGSKVVFFNSRDKSLNVFDLTTHRSQKLPALPGQAGPVVDLFWGR